MSNDVVRIPYVSVHPNYIAIYERMNYHSRSIINQEKSISNLSKNIHHNNISQSTEKKIKRSCNYLLLNSTSKHNYTRLNWKDLKFNVTFITLTLSASQMHSDNYVKKYMLNQFLIQAERIWDVKEYVWRAEKQANGNIHFHILTDKFIPWYELRGLWNNIQRKEGYIDHYRRNQQAYHKNGFHLNESLLSKWSKTNQLKAYKNGIKSNWSNPNSTDIHGLRSIGNASAYIIKYMSKNEKANHKEIKAASLGHTMRVKKGTHTLSANVLKFLREKAQIGRLWSCSRNLTHLEGGSDVVDSSIDDELYRLNNDQTIHKFSDNYYSIIVAGYEDLIRLHCTRLVNLLSEFMVKKFILQSDLNEPHQWLQAEKKELPVSSDKAKYIQSSLVFN